MFSILRSERAKNAQFARSTRKAEEDRSDHGHELEKALAENMELRREVEISAADLAVYETAVGELKGDLEIAGEERGEIEAV